MVGSSTERSKYDVAPPPLGLSPHRSNVSRGLRRRPSRSGATRQISLLSLGGARVRKHLHQRDWPTVALAMVLNAGILTGDNDFLGCGCPTWTVETLRAELQRRGSQPS
jgi:PIN domain